MNLTAGMDASGRAPEFMAPMPTQLSAARARMSTPTPAAPASAHTPAPAPANGASLLIDWPRVRGPMLEALRGAEKVVNVEVFGMLPNGSGREIADLLKQKAGEGVEANLLLDSRGGFVLPGLPGRRLVNELRDAGVNVKVAHWFARNPGARHVDHRKVVSADGKVVFLGGMNFSRLVDHWHDAMVRLDGADAAVAAAEFAGRWKEAGGVLSSRHRGAVNDAVAAAAAAGLQPETELLVNNPHRKYFEITDHYTDQIENAQERIWVASPGLTDRTRVDELEAAARRGVDVRVIVPHGAPLYVPVTRWAARSHLPRLLAAGARAYEVPGVAHTKALLTDRDATIGSYNLTRRSASADHEIATTTDSPTLTEPVRRMLNIDMMRAHPYRANERRGGIQRFFDFAINTLKISY